MSSENEDDPDVYESSGSEWNSSSEKDSKKRSSRRTSTRTKKARPKYDTTSSEESDDEDDDEEEKPKSKKQNGVSKKKQKIDSSPDSSSNKSQSSFTSKTPKLINAKDYSTGSFLILKKDAQVGDPNKPPCIWRVDGKALLQKYEPFDDSGKTKHKTTSVYTGWSALDRENYAPITVTVTHHSNQNLIVEMDWSKLKEISLDSD